MWLSRGHLLQDLDRWRQAGWVTEEGAAAISAELTARRRGPGLSGVLGILGVVMLGFAAMSFVAANWQDMPRLLRLAIIFSGLLGSYAAAALLFARRMDAFAHAAILLGVAVFGAGIMLISQMYHIDGHPPDAVLVWALGGLGAGVLLGSNPALAAASVLFSLWTGMEGAMRMTVHWPFLLAVGALALAFLAHGWRPGLHLVALMVMGWIVRVGFVVDNGHAHWMVAIIGLLVCGAAVAALHVRPRVPLFEVEAADLAPPLLGYGMATAYAGLFAQQFIEHISTPSLVLLAVLTLALLLGAIVYGVREGLKPVVWLGYVGFSVEVLAIYFKTVGTLLGSSVFYLVAGLIIIALAALARRLHRAEDQVGVVS